MNVLFLTIGRFESIEAHSIYADLLRCFRDHGHEIYVIAPLEKKSGKRTELIEEKGAHVLHIVTGNVTESKNLIRKGFAQLLLEPTYIKGIKQYFSGIKFDFVLYSTPPITIERVVEFIKNRDGAKSYLLLKDIFPQNAVDLGMMSKIGVKGILYKHFRKQEKKLYEISDRIGCMSQANVDYVTKNNLEVNPNKVGICPNSIEVIDKSVDYETRKKIRANYFIPEDKTVFVFGGNIGRPQGIPFLIECLRACIDIEKAYFLIVGDGTEYYLLENYIKVEHPLNVKLMRKIPKDDYDSMVGACDVGLLFLDHRFTIPNFPSRLLAYMQSKIPVLAVTDPNTDIGEVIAKGVFGWWCESDDVNKFRVCIENAIAEELTPLGENGYRKLKNEYSVEISYQIIMQSWKEEE